MDLKNKVRVCLPGAGIGHISDGVDAYRKGEDSKPVVFFCAGGNDLGRVPSEELVRRFKEALGRVRDAGGVPVVYGILPRRSVGDEWLSKKIAVNSRLASHCERN